MSGVFEVLLLWLVFSVLLVTMWAWVHWDSNDEEGEL